MLQFSSVQSLSPVRLFATTWIAACQASMLTNYWSLPKLMSIESVMPSGHLILCHALLFLPPIPPSIRVFSTESAMPFNHLILYCPLFFLPSIFPRIRVFSNESVLCIRWPKYWSFSFSISPSNEYSGLISFRMDWLDLLAVQGTLKWIIICCEKCH